MATVHVYQQINMLTMPLFMNASGFGGNATSFETRFGSDYIAATGDFVMTPADVPQGPITQIAIDFGDSHMFPNLILSDLHFLFDVNYYYTVFSAGNVDRLVRDVLAGADSITGSSFTDTLNGFGGSDLIHGGAANDTIYGEAGSDKLYGDAGSDYLNGGAGKDLLVGGGSGDTLYGGGAADIFRFTRVSDSRATDPIRDYIGDFSQIQGDLIDLSAIDAKTAVTGNQAFEFIGTGSFTGNAGDAQKRGELRYSINEDERFRIIEADVNGDMIADFYITLNGVKPLLVNDFIL